MSDKAHSVITSASRTTHREYFQKHQGDMAAFNIDKNGKCPCLDANYFKGINMASPHKQSGHRGGSN